MEALHEKLISDANDVLLWFVNYYMYSGIGLFISTGYGVIDTEGN